MSYDRNRKTLALVLGRLCSCASNISSLPRVFHMKGSPKSIFPSSPPTHIRESREIGDRWCTQTQSSFALPCFKNIDHQGNSKPIEMTPRSTRNLNTRYEPNLNTLVRTDGKPQILVARAPTTDTLGPTCHSRQSTYTIDIRHRHIRSFPFHSSADCLSLQSPRLSFVSILNRTCTLRLSFHLPYMYY